MTMYKVTWEQKHSLMIEAENEQEAIEAVKSGQYDTNNEAAELSTEPEAYEI